MGGKNELDRIRDEGIGLRKPAQPMMAVAEITFAPKGHPLWHPRAHLEVDRAIVESIKAEGFRRERPLIIREEGKVDGKLRFYLVAGSRRLKACWQAQEELLAEGSQRLDDGRLFVPVILFKGEYSDALIARLEENGDPTKLPDTPGVLYQMFKALADNGVDDKEIRRHAPRGCDVNAILRWPQICKKVQVRIESGEGSAALIDVLADVPMAEQPALFDTLVAAKATTARKARKAARKAAGQERPKRPSPAVLSAFAERVRDDDGTETFVSITDFSLYLCGEKSRLRQAQPAVFDKLEAVWAEASRPGKRQKKAAAPASAGTGESEDAGDVGDEGEDLAFAAAAAGGEES